MLWISATNPAVSLPDLGRVRDILRRPELFVVVQDLFLTETARLADVVLPAAGWGEKTGTFTNVDRTVHISDRAVAPPGEARSDLDIWLDYARRMDFRDRDGAPLIRWTGPEEAFEAWKACSRGRPCDYSGLTYARLREGGVQWPCTEDAPDGTERLYTDGRFNTDPGLRRDLRPGPRHRGHPHGHRAPREAPRRPGLPPRHRRTGPPTRPPTPSTRCCSRPAAPSTTSTPAPRRRARPSCRPPPPTCGRSCPRRTPRRWASPRATGSASPRGAARSRRPRGSAGSAAGHVFVPFHYGYWDRDAAGPDGGPGRAANELVRTHWDPVSKQPLFKVGAVRVTRAGEP